MRNALLLGLALSMTACFAGTRGGRDYDDQARRGVLPAQTTDGLDVTLQQDPSGDLFIVEPAQLRGQRVAVVSRDGGTMLVTRDVPAQSGRREGSGGGDDRYYHRGDDDHRGDHDGDNDHH